MKRSDTETALVAAAATVRPVTREDVTAMIAAAKVKRSIKWADVAKKVGQSKEWVTAACLGQMQLTKKQAETCINKYQPRAGFHQQAMARQLAAPDDGLGAPVHEPAAERTGRDAVQVMDSHARSDAGVMPHASRR